MSDASALQRIADHRLDLYGGDPFAHVRDASETHRTEHAASLPSVGEQECGVYPSNPQKMRFVATLVKATRASRILEIGCGLGYSALWLADAAGPGARVETIDRFPEHISLAQGYVRAAGLADRLRLIEGEATDVLGSLPGPYDLIHDDGWFAQEPSYYDRMINLLRPGGLLVMSNWFLLQHAIIGHSDVVWSQFAGPAWSEDVQAYARKLCSDPQLHVSFVTQPAWVALAVKLL